MEDESLGVSLGRRLRELGVEGGGGPVGLEFRFADGCVGSLGEGSLGEEDGGCVDVFGGLFFLGFLLLLLLILLLFVLVPGGGVDSGRGGGASDDFSGRAEVARGGKGRNRVSLEGEC